MNDTLYKRTIFILIAICLILLAIVQCERDSKPKTDTVRIEKIKTEVVTDKLAVDSLERTINGLKSKLTTVKIQRDTVQIIKYQDTIIEVQTKTIDTLKVIVLKQDTIIVYQDRVIASKEDEIKKNKRQRNLAILGGIVGVAGTIFIMK